ncbi:MAG: hypothetical protein ACYDHX_02400 [Methanothrix sp.]
MWFVEYRELIKILTISDLKRKISYGTRSEAGKAAWENQLTILDTCRKQGVSYYEYILDIISGSYSMPRLSQRLMRSKSSSAY